MPFNKDLFLQAARQGNLDEIQKQLAEADADIYANDDYKSAQTALTLAARHGHLGIVEALIKKKAYLAHQARIPQETALLAALKHNFLDIAKVLLALDQNIAIDAQDDDGNSALHIALQKGLQELAVLLIAKGANPYLKNKTGMIPAEAPFLGSYLKEHFCPYDFLKAAAANDVEGIKGQATKKAFNINAHAKADGYYETALTVAAHHGHTLVVEYLLQHKEINIESPSWDESSQTAIALAAYRNHPAIVKLLVQAGANQASQYEALKKSLINGWSPETTRYLIDEVGLDVNHCYVGEGYSLPLIYWIFYGGERPPSKELLKYLLEKDAKDKGSALRQAATFSDTDYLEILLAHGADINEADLKSGYTALMSAVSAGNLAAVQFLLAKGADPLLKNNKGETALDLIPQETYAEFKVKSFSDICQRYQNRLEIQEALVKAGKPVINRQKTWRAWEVVSAVITFLIGIAATSFSLVKLGIAVNVLNSIGLSSVTALVAALSVPVWLNFALLGLGAVLLAAAVTLTVICIANHRHIRRCENKMAAITLFNKALFLDALIINEEKQLPQQLAILKKQLEYAKHESVDINDLRDRDGLPVLVAAARQGNIEVLKFLLDADANMEVIDHEGYTALAHAVHFEKANAVSCLLAHGAKITPNVMNLAKDQNIRGLLQAEQIERTKSTPTSDLSAVIDAKAYSNPLFAQIDDKQLLLTEEIELRPRTCSLFC